MKLIARSLILVVLFTSGVKAQEVILDKSFNPVLKGYYKQFKKMTSMKAGSDTLSLPFKEDFTKDYFYPDPDKWADIDAYVNTSYPINPRSYGVATLDGLDSTGYPYNFADPVSYGRADEMTSKPIKLKGAADSVYFSFFYQPQGRGNKPDAKDSLVVDFYNSKDSTWNRQWATEGTSYHKFRQVMLFVDTNLQTDGFKFRFRNYATLSGSVDHWHIDYVYLTDARSHNDTVYSDVVYKNPHVNFIKNYESMPWWHYKVDSILNMAEFVNLRVYNYNPNTGYAINYKYNVYDESGALIETQPTADPFFTVNPALDSADIPNEIYKPTPAGPTANDFYFPLNDSVSTCFMIKNFFALDKTTTPKFDFNLENDTIVSFQLFGDYYARDDGSAEAGYGLQGINSELAYKFTNKIQDTLTGIRIYFNPVRDNMSSASFKIKVWNSSLTSVLYEEPIVVSPIYSFFDEFIDYPFSTPLLVSGTYYIGYEKITEAPMNLGFDWNIDNSANLMYNTAGIWTNSSLKGSLMMRPYFRTVDKKTVGVAPKIDQTEFELQAYPNPSNGSFTLNVSGATSPAYRVDIYDLSGKLLDSRTGGASQQYSGYSEGMYLISVTDVVNKVTRNTRIIVAK